MLRLQPGLRHVPAWCLNQYCLLCGLAWGRKNYSHTRAKCVLFLLSIKTQYRVVNSYESKAGRRHTLWMSFIQKNWDDSGPHACTFLTMSHKIKSSLLFFICHAFNIPTTAALIDSLLQSSAFCKVEFESIQSAVRLSNDMVCMF